MTPSLPPVSSAIQSSRLNQATQLNALPSHAEASDASPAEPLREAFGDFVGQTLFGSMLATMRESIGKPAYFHGGRAEEVFQQQLDQKLVEEISDASADSFVDPMFELFQMQRK